MQPTTPKTSYKISIVFMPRPGPSYELEVMRCGSSDLEDAGEICLRMSDGAGWGETRHTKTRRLHQHRIKSPCIMPLVRSLSPPNPEYSNREIKPGHTMERATKVHRGAVVLCRRLPSPLRDPYLGAARKTSPFSRSVFGEGIWVSHPAINRVLWRFLFFCGAFSSGLVITAAGEERHAEVVFALNHTLSQQEILRAGDGRLTFTTDDLIRHYNCGDLDAVIFSQDTTQVPHLGNSSLPPVDAATATHIDEYFREELIYRRNQRMGERVVEILKANPDQSFFFAFGAVVTGQEI
ncbi:putative metalloprotease TIKI1 [Penaeus vannamei]|uniref:Metalloprotease TIKI homolog n=1 Tax=Penaeus vannamei TaxID=6689 RepID=A0A3R7N5X8_PENVA|nr:putative metalloprotease TIKI1 [Penaeus vannamei]